MKRKKEKMTPLKGGRYKLHAPWHARHGEEVEIVMKRKGLSDAYHGRMIFHVAYDPDADHRFEDLDEEFVAENFKNLEGTLVSFVFDYCKNETKEKFMSLYSGIKQKFKKLFNFKFVEGPDPNAVITFYLIDSPDGPALTPDLNSKSDYYTLEELHMGTCTDREFFYCNHLDFNTEYRTVEVSNLPYRPLTKAKYGLDGINIKQYALEFFIVSKKTGKRIHRMEKLIE